jgi:hypothetical protein
MAPTTMGTRTVQVLPRWLNLILGMLPGLMLVLVDGTWNLAGFPPILGMSPKTAAWLSESVRF